MQTGRLNRILTHVSHRAMACEFVVYLPQHAGGQAVDAVAQALDGLAAIEARLTIYDPESEVSRINRFAGQAVRVSHATAGLISRAISWSERTGGALDITAGPLVDAWGFTDRRGQKPSDAQLREIIGLVNWRNVIVDESGPTVQLTMPGMKLNLGAIGKGDAMDRVADELVRCGVSDFFMHAGASSVIARGHQDADDAAGWKIGLAHPTAPRRTLGHLVLRDQALSTSGSGRQFFHHRGQRMGHVIDPRSGQPAGQSLSISVLADNATDADAASTAAFVMSAGERASLGLPMVVVDAGGRAGEVKISTHGQLDWLPAEDPAIDATEPRSIG